MADESGVESTCRVAGDDAGASRPQRTAFEGWIRRAYFSHGAWLADRYGLTPDDLLSQTAASPMPPALGLPRRPEGVEDLLIATGCCRNHPQAWIDAAEILEPLLVRAARMRLDETDAIVFARRFWTALRERTVARCRGSVPADGPAMQDYPPNRPLRNWLVDRLTGSIETAMRTDRLPRGRRIVVDSAERFRTPLQLVGSGA